MVVFVDLVESQGHQVVMSNPKETKAIAHARLKNDRVDAEKLAETSNRIPSLFPEGSVNPATSRAKPEIWQKRSEFEGYAKKLSTQATQLAAAARSGDAQATGAAAGDIGRNTCNGCHDAFRGPEIKK